MPFRADSELEGSSTIFTSVPSTSSSSKPNDADRPNDALPQTLRIAVLECDTPIGKTKDKYGGYGPLFEELLNRGADLYALEDKLPHRPALVVSRYDMVNNPDQLFPDLEPSDPSERLDAILVSGSRHNSFDNDPWILQLVELVQKVLKLQESGPPAPKLIGVCFGHQILARAMGAEVGRNDRGWETAVTPMTLTPRGKEIFGGRDEIQIHQMHQDVVHSLPSKENSPPGLECLGFSPVCDVQGIYAPSRLISVQGHPEFSHAIVEELLETRHANGVFNDEMFAAGMSRVTKTHHGIEVAAAFIRFIVAK